MADRDQLSIYHIASRPSIYEPMRDNTFEFLVHDIDNILKAGVDESVAAADTDYVTNGQEELRYAVTRANIPNFTQDSFEVQRANMSVKFAGTMKWGDGSIEVVDYVDSESSSTLLAWQRLSGDPVTEKVGRASAYKKHCTLLEYSADFELVRYWDIYGAWIKEANVAEKNAEGGNSKITISATICFDKAVPHFGNDYSE